MRNVRYNNLFRWMFQGKPYFILAGSSLALLTFLKKVMAHDDVVDDYFTMVKSGIPDIIAAEPAHGEFVPDLLTIAKYFEPIGEHCSNIAEWVKLSVTGTHKDCQ